MKKTFTLIILWLMLSVSNFTYAQGSGACLNFDGIDDDVLLSNSQLNITNDFTVEGWFNPDASAIGWTPIWDWIISGPFGGTNISYVAPGAWGPNPNDYSLYIAYFFTNGARRVYCTPINSVKVNEWNHFAVVRNGTSLIIYLNGVSQTLSPLAGWNNSTAITSTTPLSTSNNVLLAVQDTTTGAYINHSKIKLDNIRFWNSARTQTEIRDYMCRKLTAPYPPSLLGYWNFDSASGTVLSDLTANPINGTLQNTVASTWATSGAPIGDTSIYLYPATWAAQTINLSSTGNGNIQLSNVSGITSGAHVYRVDSQPNTTTGIPNGLGSNSTYYGTFFTDNTISYVLTYDYANYPDAVNDSSCLVLFGRNDNADSPWINLNATLNTATKTLTKNNLLTRKEIVLACSTGALNTQNIQSNPNLFSIFPNPFNNSTTISMTNASATKFDFILYNIYGQEVLNKQEVNNSFLLTRENLPDGIYLYKIKTIKNKFYLGKLIIN